MTMGRQLRVWQQAHPCGRDAGREGGTKKGTGVTRMGLNGLGVRCNNLDQQHDDLLFSRDGVHVICISRTSN